MPIQAPSSGRFLLSFAAAAIALALFAAWLVVPAAEPSAAKSAPTSKKERVPWTTSRVVGSPDPAPPFKTVRAFPNVKFEHPLLMARCPGSNRLFVGEQAGVIYSFVDRPDAKTELFIDLRKEIKTINLLPNGKEIEALYGLVFHPRFEQNRQCFICYTVRSKDDKPHLKDGTRVSRFTVTKTDPPRVDAASEEVVLAFLQGGHNGGDLHFGNDGMLYISTGDAGNPNPPDPFNTGQDISDLLSSVLRIDVDRKDKGQNYAVPKDNPFVGMKDARPEVWAYGFRNPWRMGFDRQTGELFVGDVGWELWESIHRVESGGNYGWSAMEGPQPVKPEKVGPTPIRPALIELPHTIACSVTGGRVYRGKKFPELRGAYIFGDWETRRLWAARFEGDRLKEMPEITRPSVRIVAFGEDANDELYFLDYDGGTVHTIERNEGVAKNIDFPTRLSQTGLFASVKDQTPAPGVTPFEVNSPQWLDGAKAQRWVAFPDVSSATLYLLGKPLPGNVDWHNFRMHFPKDAVLVRSISLGARRLETQLLHFDGVDWHAYTYAWRDDNSDADLVPADGGEKEFREGGQQRVWSLQSRSQCMSCHSSWSEYALAFQPEQLNRTDGNGHNPLATFIEAGFIQRAGKDGKPLAGFDAVAALAQERKLVDPTDASQPLGARARSYLHVNCGHCHTFGGGGAVNLRLNLSATEKEMEAVGVRPTRGDFGLPDACIIKPGDPCASTLYFRMAKFGRDRMPHIGSDRPDEAGLKLIEEWIASLKEPAGKESPSVSGPYDKLLADPKSALPVARKLGRGELKPADRDALLAAVAKLPASPTRDLFEGYFPVDEKGMRKLGSNPRPRSILSQKGEAGRGEKLFWSQALNCGSCHKIDNRGTPIGPELTTIGKLRTREDLLESILEPSRRIEPKFASYVVRTRDDRTITGVLIKRDDKVVVLRDAQGKDETIAVSNVEELRPSPISLMPAGQMAGLTAQEAADLLEYIATRK